MAIYIALLRAINVGGTGKLPMAELRTLCEGLGFSGVTTYIQSGNVVFRSRSGVAKVQKSLEEALANTIGKPVGVHLRTPAEMASIIARNPFPQAAPNRLIVLFLSESPPSKSIEGVATPDGEELALSGRELFIHFPNGQGTSKLKMPFKDTGTGRNLNTVVKLLELAEALL